MGSAGTMAQLSATELFGVKGMVFVITGGGTGIGAMMASALDINGAAKVYILGRRLEKLEEVASKAVNGSIIPIQGDITSKASLTTAVEKVQSEVPFVNVVIANSGTMGPTLDGLPKDHTPPLSDLHAYLWNTPMSAFTETFNINTTATFYTMLAFLPLLDAGNTHPTSPTLTSGIKSQFIATSSIGAFSRRPGAGFAYAASKAGVIHMVKQLATYLVPYHIRVNTIAPGIYPSDMSSFTAGRDAAAAADPSAEGTWPLDEVPATRMGSAEDMAGVTLFLCGRAGAYINGNVICTDGGRLCVKPATY